MKIHIRINITYLCHFLSQLIILRNDENFSKHTLHNLQLAHSTNESEWVMTSLFQIRDGDQGYSPLIDKFCGSSFPPIITSSGGSLWLRWPGIMITTVIVIIIIIGLSRMGQYNMTGSVLCTNSFQTLSKAFHLSPSVSLKSVAQRTILVSFNPVIHVISKEEKIITL